MIWTLRLVVLPLAYAFTLATSLPAIAAPTEATFQSPRSSQFPAVTNSQYATQWVTQPSRRRLTRRFSLELELGPVWQTRNEVAVPGNGGTRINLDDITGAGPFPYSRINFDWRISRRHRLRALIAPLQIQETGTLAEPVSFNGVNFAAGVPTEATYKFNSYRIGYRYLLACGNKWSVFIGATAKIRDAKIELRQGGTMSRKTDLGFVPLLHIDAEWRFRPGWRLTADLDGAAAPQGRAFDFALKIHRDISSRWSVGLGYRTIEGGADNDRVYTFAWLHQALVSVSYRF
jgi:hypothetical protein